MRVLFSIVIVLGLLLTSLSIFEVRVVSECRSKVNESFSMLQLLEQKQAGRDKQQGWRGWEPLSSSFVNAYGQSWKGLDDIERGWLAAACIGGVLFVLGIAGIVAGRRASFQKSPPNTALEPTPTAP